MVLHSKSFADYFAVKAGKDRTGLSRACLVCIVQDCHLSMKCLV
jgi:hypothetical protein